MKEKLRKTIQPILQPQSLYQLNQMKTFVDSSLSEVASKKFDSDTDKVKYLLNVLYDIRDFVLSQTTENSVRIQLIKQFDRIEEEELLGNSQQKQEENLLLKTEESLEPDLAQLEKNEEKEIESTTDS